MRTLPPGSVALLALLMTACGEASNDPMSSTAPTADLHTGLPDLGGSLVAADGTAICGSVPEGTAFLVRAIDVSTLQFAGAADVVCPSSDYIMAVPPGTYMVRVQFLNAGQVAGELPWRTVTRQPVTVAGEDLVLDIPIEPGTALGGRATLDGRPVEGVTFNVVYDALPGFGAASGVSGADGGWADFFGRAPLFLQNDVDYLITAGCQPLLGSILDEGFPTRPFRFPDELGAVNCAMRSGASEPFTHTYNRLAVTALPGDLGGLSPDIDPGLGLGFGVQFPTVPGAAPAHGPLAMSHLFRGGLIIGLESGAILTGFDAAGELECGAGCRDLGLDGKAQVTATPARGKRVTWRYSDAGSSEGVGLRIVQRSYDAPASREYVLFRFSIQNRSARTQRLAAGVFADWDVDGSALDDVGISLRGGRLLAVSNADGPPTHAGTLVAGGAPPGPGYFFSGLSTPSLADQAAVLAGSLSQSPGEPGDIRYIHGISPVELGHGGTAELWVAVVLGEDAAKFAANADAALRDVDRRRHAAEPAATAGEAVVLRRAELQPGAGSTPGERPCKGGCAK